VIGEIAVAEVICFKVLEEEGLAFGVGEEVVEILEVWGEGEFGEDLAELEAVDIRGVEVHVPEGESGG
jgi:hypothetical protein